VPNPFFHFGFQLAGQLEEALDVFPVSFWLASRIALVSILGELGSSSLSFDEGLRGSTGPGAWGSQRTRQDSQRHAKRPKCDHESTSRILHWNPNPRHPHLRARQQFIEPLQCYTPSLVKIMSSLFAHWSEFAPRNALHLLGILVIALLVNRLLRAVTKPVDQAPATQHERPKSGRNRRADGRGSYGAASKVIWGSRF